MIINLCISSLCLQVPQDPSTLRKNIYFCPSCSSYLPSTEFQLSSNSSGVGRCRRCTKLDNDARTRQDYSQYRFMLKGLRKSEEGMGDGSRIAFLIQVSWFMFWAKYMYVLHKRPFFPKLMHKFSLCHSNKWTTDMLESKSYKCLDVLFSSVGRVRQNLKRWPLFCCKGVSIRFRYLILTYLLCKHVLWLLYKLFWMSKAKCSQGKKV